MTKERPMKQLLVATRKCWDHAATPDNVRENFLKVINCGTSALGAEVFASGSEMKVVYHTCKSKFCTSCGQRATEAWQQEVAAVLPDIPYVGITLTMPKEFWPIFQNNRHLLRGMPAIGAEAIRLWAQSRYGVHVLMIAVQHTFGGFLNFYPHLHVLVSAGGIDYSQQKWRRIAHARRDERERPDLMQAWRYAIITYLSEALNAQVLTSEMSAEEVRSMFAVQHKRRWNIDVSYKMSKAHFVKYVGRYIRRPPIAQHRLTRATDQMVEYLAKDTRNGRFVNVRHTNDQFVAILQEQVQDRGRHAMRYFGLLAPRTKACTWAAVFLSLNQKQKPIPCRLGWRHLLHRTFGIDPLIDSLGQEMHWVGRLSPVVV